MNNLKETELLAESGADELSIMEFVINNELYGINIAKVKEIISVMPVKPMQKSNPNVEGIFKLRDQVITVIDLGAYLGLPASEDPEKDIFIITSLNHQDFAFHVHRVVGIDQLTWAEMKKPDKTIYGGGKGIATGIADFENRLITILDFEKIIMELNPESNELYSNIEKLGARERTEKHILVAEDSILLSKMIIDSLHKAGYVNTTKAENGLEAWEFLCEARDSGDDINDHVACIVSDIEMPQMDGYTLTKKVKTDSVLKEIPLVLFSSLITDEMKYKGKELGADAQISKPEIANLVSMIDKLITDEPAPTNDEETEDTEKQD